MSRPKRSRALPANVVPIRPDVVVSGRRIGPDQGLTSGAVLIAQKWDRLGRENRIMVETIVTNALRAQGFP